MKCRKVLNCLLLRRKQSQYIFLKECVVEILCLRRTEYGLTFLVFHSKTVVDWVEINPTPRNCLLCTEAFRSSSRSCSGGISFVIFDRVSFLFRFTYWHCNLWFSFIIVVINEVEQSTCCFFWALHLSAFVSTEVTYPRNQISILYVLTVVVWPNSGSQIHGGFMDSERLTMNPYIQQDMTKLNSQSVGKEVIPGPIMGFKEVPKICMLALAFIW